MKHKKRNIRNPQKWVGRYVRHMANWRTWQWIEDGYFVCEWTGKLFRTDDEWYPIYEDEKEFATKRGYDECCYYSTEAGQIFTKGYYS